MDKNCLLQHNLFFWKKQFKIVRSEDRIVFISWKEILSNDIAAFF